MDAQHTDTEQGPSANSLDAIAHELDLRHGRYRDTRSIRDARRVGELLVVAREMLGMEFEAWARARCSLRIRQRQVLAQVASGWPAIAGRMEEMGIHNISLRAAVKILQGVGGPDETQGAPSAGGSKNGECSSQGPAPSLEDAGPPTQVPERAVPNEQQTDADNAAQRGRELGTEAGLEARYAARHRPPRSGSRPRVPIESSGGLPRRLLR